MRDLPRLAVVYLLAVYAAGIFVLARAAQDLPLHAGLLAEAGVFVVLGILADVKRLRLSYGATHSTSVAINFACTVVFGPLVATWQSAAAAISSDLILRKPIYKGAFNASAICISVAVGGAALEALRRAPAGRVDPSDLPAFVAYSLVNSLLNHMLVCFVIALTTRTRPWEVIAANYKGLMLPIGALYPIGVLMAVTYVHFGKWLGFLLLAVPTVAVYSALDRAQQLRAHTRVAIEALADAIDQRDKYTAEHSRRVAEYAEQIVRALGLSLAQREEIVSAARVHDLGKISTPDAVLRAPRELTDEEWELMRQHPRVGQQILEKLPMYREGARLVGLHHERLDGRGYPLGLPAERIPLGARILTVADAFDAMTSDRPYRSAMPEAAALARLREGAGTQFAPEVVEAFTRVRQGAPPAQRGALLGLAPGPPARAGAPGT